MKKEKTDEAIGDEAIGVTHTYCFHCEKLAPIKDGAFIGKVFSCPDCFEEALEWEELNNEEK